MRYPIFVKSLKTGNIVGKILEIRDAGFAHKGLDKAGKKADADKGIQCGNRRCNKRGKYCERMRKTEQRAERSEGTIKEDPAQHKLEAGLNT